MKNKIKENRAYIIVAAVVIIILVLIFTGRGGDDKIVGENQENISTTTVTNTNKPAGSTGGSKGTVSKPVTASPTPTPVVNPSQNKPSQTVPTAASLNGSIFRLQSYNGASLPTDAKYTISFDGGKLNARFCNSLSSDFVLDGSLLKTTNLIGTMMYCSTPANLMTIETAFTSMLGAGATIYKSGDSIILSHVNAGVLVFEGF